MMDTTNENVKFHNGNSLWYFIAEFSLSEIAVDEIRGAELTGGALFQALREIGIPLEILKTVVSMIKKNIGGANGIFDRSLPYLPDRYLLYCDRKTAYNKHHSIDRMDGGWGLYLIERGRDFTINSPQESCRIVEIYLYKEVV